MGRTMALLIVNLDKMIGNAEAWRAAFPAELPGPDLPNLKSMFSRSAGVEEFVNHPRLPKAPLGKIEPDGGDPMMTEYTVMHVLRFHREMPKYEQAQKNREWLRRKIVRPEERRIGFLG